MLRLKRDTDKRLLIIAHRDGVPDIRFFKGVMLPNISGVGIPDSEIKDFNEKGNSAVLALKPNPAIARGEVRIEQREGTIVVQTTYRAASDHILSAWTIAPEGSLLNWDYLANFRNRHYHHLPYKQVSLHGMDDGYFGAPGSIALSGSNFPSVKYRGITPVSENTYSMDWQFAPHPTAFIFQAPRCNLLAGCLSLPQGFGMYLDIFEYKVSRWEIDLGGAEYGQKVSAGQEVSSPEFVFSLDHDEDVYHTARSYHDLLVKWRYIPDPSTLPTYPVWHMPFIATWFDQCERAGRSVRYHDQGEVLLNAQTALTTDLIDREIAHLKQTGIPFGIFDIDDGWAICRGDWEMDSKRMTGIRERIDELHKMGLKVILWWAPFDIYPEARMRQRKDLLCGNGVLSLRGRIPLIDFSNPHVQETYLKPMARLWFSPEAGCYNADGFKTDFMADKIHPEMPVYNPDWRGEERFIFNTLKLFITEGRCYKPDLIHQACVSHPYFEEITAFNRCYDNPGEYRSNFERKRMLQAFQPGNFINTTADSSDHSDLEIFLEEALRTGHAVEIGGVLGFTERPYSDSEIKMLDRHVRAFIERWCK